MSSAQYPTLHLQSVCICFILKGKGDRRTSADRHSLAKTVSQHLVSQKGMSKNWQTLEFFSKSESPQGILSRSAKVTEAMASGKWCLPLRPPREPTGAN